MTKVVVLGCGPAGLIAAHAAAEHGCDVRILSKARKSHMRGAQYLHQPIPDVPSTRFEIDYRLVGTAQAYADKVYGSQRGGHRVSPEDLVGQHPAWDIREAYDWLWGTYSRYVTDFSADLNSLRWLISDWRPELLVSTVPRPLFCAGKHTFNAKKIWSTDQDLGYLGKEDNVVVCNGEDAPSWYRLARVNGWDTVEWSIGTPPVTPLWDVMKPLDHNCDCVKTVLEDFKRPPMYLEAGRYGRWQKGVLSHETYWEVEKCILSLQ